MKIQSALLGNIILARILEYSVERFIAFVNNTESSPLYKRLVRDGIIEPKSVDGEISQNSQKGSATLAKNGVIVSVEGTDNISLNYTARELAIEYQVNHQELTNRLNDSKLADEEKRDITGLIYKLRRINSRNQIVKRILDKIIEQQKGYFISGNELDMKPLSQAQVARLISASENANHRPGFTVDSSRISRALRKSSIITPARKQVPLRFFFVSKKDMVKKSIKAIVIQEKKDIGSGRMKKAHTDEELRRIIKENYGLLATRREVAYCRKELGILPYPERNGYAYHMSAANYSRLNPFTASSVETHAPQSPGVYELCIADGVIEYPMGYCPTFYIGSAKNLRKRLLSHLSSSGKNGGIKQVLQERPCLFRFLRFTQEWDHEEKRFYHLFVSTYGDSPQCNHMSPKISGEQKIQYSRISQTMEVTMNNKYFEPEKERRFLRNVMATIPDSLLVLDKEHRVKDANRSFCKLFQARLKEVIGRKITDVIGDEDGSLRAKLTALASTKNKLGNFELHHESEETGKRIFNLIARRIIVAEEEEEEEEELLLVMQDITERRIAEESLRRTEANFRRSMDDSPLGIRIVDSDGTTIYVNRVMLALYGYDSLEELKMTPVQKRYTPDSHAEHRVRKEKRQRGEYVPANYEISIVRKDGEIRHLEVFRKEVLWNSHTQFQVIYQDITERNIAEEALKDSEQRLKTTIMNAPIGIATSGRDRYFLSANDTFCGILGYTEAELQKMSFKDITHPDDMKESSANLDAVDAGKIPSFSQEKRYIRKDGKVIIGRVMVSNVRDQKGKPYLYIAELEDITERKRTEEALRQSEERYRSLVDNVKLGIFRSTPGPSGRFLEVNRAIEEITGYSRAELLQMDVSSLYVHPEERESVIRDYALAQGKMTKEVDFKKKDGTEIVVADTKTPVRDVTGRALYFDGVMEDITEHKQAEELLRQSEEKLRLTFESVAEGIAITDLEGVIAEVNQRMLDMHSLSAKEQMVGKPVLKFVALHDHEKVALNMQRTMEGEKLEGLEVSALRSDGSIFTVEVNASVLKDSSGQAKGSVATLRDITERKNAAEEIRRLLDRETQSVREWQETFDAVADIIMLISPRHEILKINRAGCEATGKKAEELIGRRCYEVIHGMDAPIEQCPCAEALETKKSYTSEFTSQGRHYLLTAYPIFDKSGEISAFAHIVEDITETRHAEEEKLVLERKAYDASRLASIGEMAAGIAHEINNPLTPIVGFAEILMGRELPEDINADLKVIYDSARRMADVTRRLLTFARQSKPLRALCDINEVVKSTLELRAYHLRTNNINVISELDPELPQTMADAGQLQQVVLNLIMNAEYSMARYRGSGNLLIKTANKGNKIQMSARDDGQGISEENMGRIFTPFFTTKKAGEGTGLGLSVCHGIVTEHNGRIYAESELGKGATFTVELPIISHPKEDEPKPVNSEIPGDKATVNRKILVVDDEPTILQVLQQVLTDEGYEVRTASKAKEAMKLIQDEQYGCVLSDIKLPDMSGIELYQQLNEIDKSLTQRIIFITGDIMGTDTMDFFSRTGASYLTKPFEMEQLKRKVKMLFL